MHKNYYQADNQLHIQLIKLQTVSLVKRSLFVKGKVDNMSCVNMTTVTISKTAIQLLQLVLGVAALISW